MNSALDLAVRTSVCVHLRQGRRNLGTHRLMLDRTLSSEATLVWRSSPTRAARGGTPGGTVSASVTMSRSGSRAIGIAATLTEVEEWSEPPGLLAFDSVESGVMSCAYVRYTVESVDIRDGKSLCFVSSHMVMNGALMQHIVFW